RDSQSDTSLPSSTRAITIDVDAPVVSVPAVFDFEARQAVLISFSETLSPLPQPTVRNLDTGATLPANAFIRTISGTNFTFTASPKLSDGNYRMTFPAASTTDKAGNPLASDYVFDFFVLTADANRD